MYAILYPEAIVASFIYSVSYRVHGGAIVAVFFFSGLRLTQGKEGNKKVVHRKAIAYHKSLITVFIVEVCWKNDCGGCKGGCHGCPTLHCRTGLLAPRSNSPLVEDLKLWSAVHLFFSDIYLCLPTCLLMWASS